MPPTDTLIRLSDGTMCSAWGGMCIGRKYHYHFLNGTYEEASHFRHATEKDYKDLEDGLIQYRAM